MHQQCTSFPPVFHIFKCLILPGLRTAQWRARARGRTASTESSWSAALFTALRARSARVVPGPTFSAFPVKCQGAPEIGSDFCGWRACCLGGLCGDFRRARGGWFAGEQFGNGGGAYDRAAPEFGGVKSARSNVAPERCLARSEFGREVCQQLGQRPVGLAGQLERHIKSGAGS